MTNYKQDCFWGGTPRRPDRSDYYDEPEKEKRPEIEPEGIKEINLINIPLWLVIVVIILIATL